MRNETDSSQRKTIGPECDTGVRQGRAQTGSLASLGVPSVSLISNGGQHVSKLNAYSEPPQKTNTPNLNLCWEAMGQT